MSSFETLLHCAYSIYILIVLTISLDTCSCLDNANDITYANLNLTFQNTNENLYFNKGGVYSRDSDMQPVNGMLHLVSANNLNDICLNKSFSQHVALIELKEAYSSQDKYIKCFDVAIWITVSDEEFFLSSSKQCNISNEFCSFLNL